MNSRERVQKAINHVEPDRIPIDLGSTAASGINIDAYIRLKKLLGLPTDNIRVFDIFGMMAQVEADVVALLGIDTILVPSLRPRFEIRIDEWKPWRLSDGTPVQVPVGFQTVKEKDGSQLLMVGGAPVGRMPKDGHYFSEVANSTMGGLDSLVEPPDPDTVTFPGLTDEDLRFRQEIARNLREATDKALIVDLVDNLRWNTSIPNWLYAMGADPEKTFALHEKKSQHLLETVKRLAEAVGPNIDVFAIYQDYGTQRAELVSPEMFERLVLPNYRRLFDWIHRNTKWKVLFHSCGSIYKLIPYMIQMGVDILNPVQCAALRMEPDRLKAEFGSSLVFWGGGVDTQTILPFGTKEDVCQQVRDRLSMFGAGGGFVFAPSQDIQADVPATNVMAMYDAALEYGRYPLSERT